LLIGGKIQKLCLIPIFLFSVSSPLWASEEWKALDPDTSAAHFSSKILKDLSFLFTTDNASILCVGTIATAYDWGAYDRDNALASDLKKWNVRPLFDFGNFYGEGWVEGGAALGSWTLGSLIDDPKLQQFGRDASESLLLATLLVTGAKLAVNRERPDGGKYSFPSGHTITAFCVAPVVQKYWGWEAGIPAYLVATWSGLSRVEVNRHYLSDVIAGATLGIIIGNSVVHSPKDVTVSVAPGAVNFNLAFN
jgi:hypothetical protein